ncbi:phenylalanine--tRNA ligase subunit alpha [Patescibacteria group bacterium]|nr:phenylalanine--tRNA ligase subunit alpha [Patescibacteria group bacterium]
MVEKLKKLKENIENQIKDLKNKEDLEALYKETLGKKSDFNKILRSLSDLSIEEKKEIGPIANEIKNEINKIFGSKRLELENEEINIKLKKDKIDLTLDINKEEAGSLNPITKIQYELEEIFKGMGFAIYDGPELELDYYNFESLNIPKHHPARDMQDTFYINKEQVLRTQTSNLQVRAMREFGAPLKVIMPGKVYRNEDLDACHEHTFHQLEGVVIDKNINLSHLISTMNLVISKIFNREIETRVRPGYFPFVEPGIEIDIKCTICGGKGCPSCKNTGWLEILPGGLVHPNVIKAGDLDPEEYSGFAFGLGLTRLVMMRYGISDIRDFMSGDLRFIKQF